MYFARAFHQQATRQAARAGADFHHIASGQVSGLARNAARHIQFEDKVLAEFLIGAQFMAVDNIA
jgi:hypothetical protein